MFTMILELITNALGTVSNWFKWKSSPVKQHTDAEAVVKRDERAAQNRRAEVNRAVHTGDEAKVNRIVNGLALLWALMLSASLLSCACGCRTPEPRYVAADRVVTCVTNETGAVLYWRVPPLVMEELLNSKLELEEMKHQNKVKEITK